MKYLMTILMIFSLSVAVAVADDDPSGECRKLFKASKEYIDNATNILADINSLYYNQENAIISKNEKSANDITSQIIIKLEKAKINFKSAIPLTSQAMRKCTGRSGIAQKLLLEAKSGVEEILFKVRINNNLLTNN